MVAVREARGRNRVGDQETAPRPLDLQRQAKGGIGHVHPVADDLAGQGLLVQGCPDQAGFPVVKGLHGVEEMGDGGGPGPDSAAYQVRIRPGMAQGHHHPAVRKEPHHIEVRVDLGGQGDAAEPAIGGPVEPSGLVPGGGTAEPGIVGAGPGRIQKWPLQVEAEKRRPRGGNLSHGKGFPEPGLWTGQGAQHERSDPVAGILIRQHLEALRPDAVHGHPAETVGVDIDEARTEPGPAQILDP